MGDALSDYDVGRVNLALDGPDAAVTALASVERLVDLDPLVLLPAHGPIPTDTGAALAAAQERVQRLVQDPGGAVWYAARRIFAFALMIYGGIPTDQVETYLHDRAWLVDAARLLEVPVQTLVEDLIETMTRSGAVVTREGRLLAAAPHTPVQPQTLQSLPPRRWPSAGRGEGATTTQ